MPAGMSRRVGMIITTTSSTTIFAHAAGEIRARTYLDDIQKVALYLPKSVDFSDDVVKLVVLYLRFRFTTVEWLTATGYEPIPSSA